MNEIVITTTNGQLTTSSLGVAERFGKQHKHVIETIEELKKGVAEKSADLFIESVYQHPQNKQWYKYYELTRDGFSLLVMGFTGKKALEWKLKYIEAFNRMEQELRACSVPKQMTQAEIIAAMAQQNVETEKRITQLEATVDKMKETISVNSENWRKTIHMLVGRIASASGLDFRAVYLGIYDELERRAGCKLSVRFDNLYSRMEKRGVADSVLGRLNYVDVIANDKKLIEIYVAIVKEMAVKYDC